MITARRIFKRSEPWVLAAIVMLSLLIQARSGQFFTGNNLVDLARALIIPGLLSTGVVYPKSIQKQSKIIYFSA